MHPTIAAAKRTRTTSARALLLTVTVAAAALASSARGETEPETKVSPPARAATLAPPRTSPYRPENVTFGARKYYAATLGIDDLKVRRTNAGNLIRFSYRVVDPGKARSLGERQDSPYLVGLTSHAMLQVPVMDKVGPLRQATRPEAGKEYWMVFSNKGDRVKAGERVTVVVGKLRVEGLRVD